jgi:hypothetical protein
MLSVAAVAFCTLAGVAGFSVSFVITVPGFAAAFFCSRAFRAASATDCSDWPWARAPGIHTRHAASAIAETHTFFPFIILPPPA